jgi:hypothetical protein
MDNTDNRNRRDDKDNYDKRHRRDVGYHMKKHRDPQGQQPNKFNSKYPDRWSKYPPLGQLIPGTRFLPFKTPLSFHFFEGKDDIPFMISDIVKEVSVILDPFLLFIVVFILRLKKREKS